MRRIDITNRDQNDSELLAENLVKPFPPCDFSPPTDAFIITFCNIFYSSP